MTATHLWYHTCEISQHKHGLFHWPTYRSIITFGDTLGCLSIVWSRDVHQNNCHLPKLPRKKMGRKERVMISYDLMEIHSRTVKLVAHFLFTNIHSPPPSPLTLFCFLRVPVEANSARCHVLGDSGGVVNSFDFCPAFWCVPSSQWKAVTVNFTLPTLKAFLGPRSHNVSGNKQ